MTGEGELMNKTRQRQRTTRIFIESAAEIIRQEGFNALTVRKVADHAAYNSATIYNYFDNLEHLKSLTAMIFMKDYTDALDDCIKDCTNTYEINESVWTCFYRYSYRRPQIYQSIFGHPAHKKHNAFINDFYVLFPERLTVESQEVKGMLVEDNLFDRTMFLLRECAKEGYFNFEDLEEIYELLFFVYKGMLNKLLVCPECMTEDDFVSQAQNYTKKIFNGYKKS